PLSDHDEIRLRTDRQDFIATIVRPVRQIRHAPRRYALHLAGHGGDPLRCRAATAADDVHPAVASELAEHLRGRVAADALETAHAIRQAGVGITGDWPAGYL